MPTESQIRKRIAQETDTDPNSRHMWEALNALEPDTVIGAIRDGEPYVEDLVDLAKTLKPVVAFQEGRRPRKKRRTLEEYEFRLDGGEEDTARVLAEFTALNTTLHSEVVRFREEILGNKLLTEDEAFRLVYSEAASHFSLEWFAEWDVPLRDHESELGENFFVWRGDTAYEREYVRVDPPRRTFRVRVPEPYNFFDELPSMRFVPDVRTSRVSYKEGLTRKITNIVPGSVLDELRLASIEVEKRTAPRWNAGQAAWFILTGRAPVPFVIVGSTGATTSEGEFEDVYGKDTITLEVEPWVPADTVAKVYRDLQLGVLGKFPRTAKPRNLRILAFVLRSWREQLRSAQVERRALRRLIWRELMQEWNEANPHDAYTSYKIFNRDFHRAAKKIPNVEDYFDDLLAVPGTSEMLGR